MNRFLVLMAALIIVIVVLSCQSDIVLPPDAPLRGTYTGVYSYITKFRSPKEVTRKAHVIFIFDETAYHMNLDTTYSGQECFCAVDGQYLLTEGVRLKEDVYGPEGDCSACNEELNPQGVFTRETKGDSLILKFQETTTTLQMLRLYKVSD